MPVQPRTCGTLPEPPNRAKAAPNDPEQVVVTSFPSEAMFTQVKLMKVLKRIRSLKARTTSGGYANDVTEVTPTVEAMKLSGLEEVTSELPDHTTNNFTRSQLGSLLCLSEKILVKVRSSTAETPGEAMKSTSVEVVTSRLQLDPATESKAVSDNWQKLASFFNLKKRIRSLFTRPTSTNGSKIQDLPQRYATCPSSPTGSHCSDGYVTCPPSPAAGSPGSLRCESEPSEFKLPPAGSSDSRIDSSCARAADPKKSSAAGGRSDSKKNSDFASSDSRRSFPTGGRTESWKHSTLAASSGSRRSSPTGGRTESRKHSTLGASSDSRRSSPIAGRTESRKHSTLAASSDSRRSSPSAGRTESRKQPTLASSQLRRFSTGATFGSTRNSASAESELRRSSTGARFDSERSYPTYASPDPRRHSTCGSETFKPPGANSTKTLKALLTPGSMSMGAILRTICTEETVVSQPDDSRVLPPSFSSARRSSTSELFVRPGLPKRFLSSENLDLSTIMATGPEVEAPQDRYSNSNISWSSPLEDDGQAPPKVDSPTKEEPPRQSISGPSSTSASIPSDHFAVYVGSERKKFVISSQVVTHQLFKKLLVNGNYKLEENDGKIFIVLLCDADYFQRLLFLVDQRKSVDMETLEARRSVSACSRRSFDLLAPEPRISVVSSSG